MTQIVCLIIHQLPILIENAINSFENDPDNTHSKIENKRQIRRPNDVDEQDQSRVVGFVEGLMEKRVVEDEEFFIAPVVFYGADLYVSLLADVIV